jgi:hypothetical protein
MKVSSRRSGDEPGSRRSFYDLIADIAEDQDRTDRFLSMMNTATDSLVRLILVSAMLVGGASGVLVYGSNGNPRLLGWIGLASAGVAGVAGIAGAIRRRLRERRVGEPDPPSERR